MKNYILIAISVFILSACNRNSADDTVEPSIGKAYYPLKLGSTWLYSVDSVAYDDNGPVQAIDTFFYQYKEQITDAITDDIGNTSYIVSRFFRANDTSDWMQSRNFTSQIADNKVQRVEEGTRLVKLVFPLRMRNSWNGNMFNNRDYQSYRVVDFKTPYVFNGTANHSIKIEESNVVNFIEEITRTAQYAEGIGLVNLHYDSLNTQTTGTRGFRYKLQLQSYMP